MSTPMLCEEVTKPFSSITCAAASAFAVSTAAQSINSWHASGSPSQQQLPPSHHQQQQQQISAAPQYVSRYSCEDVDMNCLIFPDEETARFRSHQQARFVPVDPLCVDDPSVATVPVETLAETSFQPAPPQQLQQRQQSEGYPSGQQAMEYSSNIRTPRRKPKRCEFASLAFECPLPSKSEPLLIASEISINSQSDSCGDSTTERMSLIGQDNEKTRRKETLANHHTMEEEIYTGPETMKADRFNHGDPVTRQQDDVETQRLREDTMRLHRNSPSSPDHATIAIRRRAAPVSDAAYWFNASKAQSKEIESIRWAFTDEKIRRQVELERKCEQWGSIVERKNGIYFRPGKQRDSLSQLRSNVNEAACRDFRTEEARHKHECILALQEKNSDFSMLPVLGNRFILRRLLGKGGNGEVWDVIDYVDNKRPCALKISSSYHHTQREHQTHNKLNHENIVKVGPSPFTIEYNDKIYTAFTIESVDTDLQKLIEMFGPFDENSALKILFELLSALVYLHYQMGTAHYDLKPANILVSRDRCVKLTDFDLARSVSTPAISCDEGTIKYLPPECFHGHFGKIEDCTAEKADMWMVGVVFCAMLFGKHPIYPDKTPTDAMKNFIGQYDGRRFQFSIEKHPISNLSQQVIFACLHPDPKCRPCAIQVLRALMSATGVPEVCSQ